MRRPFIIAWALLLAGFVCLGQSSAYWQSRDSNYNVSIVSSGALACSYTPIQTATQSVLYTGATPSASGGTPSYTYSISAGSISPFTLNTGTGIISGTDSSVETLTGIQLTVTDSLSNTANCGSTFQIAVSSAYTGPGDIQTFSGWYSLYHCYNAAYSGNVADVYAPSDASHTLITCSAGGTINETLQSLATTCAVSCTLKTLTNQVNPGTYDLVQATSGSRFLVLLNCVNTSLPCILGTTTAGTSMASASNFTPATGVVSFVWVAYRTSSSPDDALRVIEENGSTSNRSSISSNANTWAGTGGTSGSVTATANEKAWHAAAFVMNGASSLVNIDGGSDETGTATGSTSAEAPTLERTSFFFDTFHFAEMGFVDNVVISSGKRTSLCKNEADYYGISGAACY